MPPRCRRSNAVATGRRAWQCEWAAGALRTLAHAHRKDGTGGGRRERRYGGVHPSGRRAAAPPPRSRCSSSRRRHGRSSGDAGGRAAGGRALTVRSLRCAATHNGAPRCHRCRHTQSSSGGAAQQREREPRGRAMQSARAATPLTCSSAMLACDPSAALQRLLRRRGRCSLRPNGGALWGGRAAAADVADVTHPVAGCPTLCGGRLTVWVIRSGACPLGVDGSLCVGGSPSGAPDKSAGIGLGKTLAHERTLSPKEGRLLRAEPKTKKLQCIPPQHPLPPFDTAGCVGRFARIPSHRRRCCDVCVCVRPGSIFRHNFSHTHTSQKFPQPCTPSALQLRLVTVSSFHPLKPWRNSSAVS